MALDRGMQAVVTTSAFTGLAVLFVLIRCISRFCIIKQAGTEDYLAVVAVLFSIGLTVIIGLQREHGLGRHADTVSAEDNEMLAKLLYASVLIYNFGLMVVKDSILYQYLRFFVARNYRRAAWGLIVFITTVGIVMIITEATWSSCELNVGIACSCVPAFRPLISLIFPRLLASTRRDHTSDPFSRGAAYYRNDSVVELSRVGNGKVESDGSRDDAVSFDTTHTPGTIRVKQEWSITEKEGP